MNFIKDLKAGGRGHWTVHYTGPQSFIIRWLNNFGDLFNFIGWFIKLSFQMFQPIIVIYRRVFFCIIIGGMYINLSAIVVSP